MRKLDAFERIFWAAFALLLFINTVIASLVLTGRSIVIQPRLDKIDVKSVVENRDATNSTPYITELEAVPAPIKQAFVARKWTLAIDSERVSALTEDNPDIRYTGFTSYNEQLVCVITPESVHHEIGHFLQFTLNFDKVHLELYREEAKRVSIVLGQYATENSNEYFAVYFSHWLSGKDRSELLRLSPRTYQYFSELEANNWGQNTARVIFPKKHIVWHRNRLPTSSAVAASHCGRD